MARGRASSARAPRCSSPTATRTSASSRSSPAAGIARSSFYRFFANREDVLANIIRPVFVDGLAHLESIAARDARGVLHGIFDAYLALWAASPDALRLSTRTGGVYFELFRDLHMPFRERITALLRLVEPERRPPERQRRLHGTADRPHGGARAWRSITATPVSPSCSAPP